MQPSNLNFSESKAIQFSSTNEHNRIRILKINGSQSIACKYLNHLENLEKHNCQVPLSEILIQEVWTGTKNMHFEQVPRCCGCCWLRGHTLRTTGINGFAILQFFHYSQHPQRLYTVSLLVTFTERSSYKNCVDKNSYIGYLGVSENTG